MPYSVEVYFESEVENLVREIWKDLAYSNISSYMLDGNYRPHVSLTVFDEAIPGFNIEFEKYIKNLPPFSIKFDSIGIFPRPEGVVFLAAVVNDALLTLHQDFNKRFADLMTGVRSYYLPGNWIPHCTLGYRIDSKMLSRAVSHCSEIILPISANNCSVGLVGSK
jgi:hypothetical protein